MTTFSFELPNRVIRSPFHVTGQLFPLSRHAAPKRCEGGRERAGACPAIARRRRVRESRPSGRPRQVHGELRPPKWDAHRGPEPGRDPAEAGSLQRPMPKGRRSGPACRGTALRLRFMESPLSLFCMHWNHELERPERGCVGVKGRQRQRVEKSGVLRLVSDTAALRPVHGEGESSE